MSWFWMAIASVVVAALLGLDRIAELMLAAACVIGYLETRIPRDISVTLTRPPE